MLLSVSICFCIITATCHFGQQTRQRSLGTWHHRLEMTIKLGSHKLQTAQFCTIHRDGSDWPALADQNNISRTSHQAAKALVDLLNASFTVAKGPRGTAIIYLLIVNVILIDVLSVAAFWLGPTNLSQQICRSRRSATTAEALWQSASGRLERSFCAYSNT